jgi:hypothetical protein
LRPVYFCPHFHRLMERAKELIYCPLNPRQNYLWLRTGHSTNELASQLYQRSLRNYLNTDLLSSVRGFLSICLMHFLHRTCSKHCQNRQKTIKTKKNTIQFRAYGRQGTYHAPLILKFLYAGKTHNWGFQENLGVKKFLAPSKSLIMCFARIKKKSPSLLESAVHL